MLQYNITMALEPLILGPEIMHKKYTTFVKVISFAECRTVWWGVILQLALRLTVTVCKWVA
jgi:hypothetical protein